MGACRALGVSVGAHRTDVGGLTLSATDQRSSVILACPHVATRTDIEA